ncbi:MAG: Hsp70 family protein [Verrucomicrobiales bacterium]|nr:Hsp70 family protein [Verrucomicrobiales bacterium]
MEEDLIIGIDLGTTNSLIGVVDSGFPIILADEEKERLTPSSVSYLPDGKILVGRESSRVRTLHPTRSIDSVKRFMGRPASDLTAEELDSSLLTFKKGEADELSIKIDEELSVTPVEVSAEILKRLKRIAEDALETEVHRAVITVPAYFNNSQREATKLAAEKAGLSVARIINEPTAAALAYGLDKSDEHSTIAVYDLGGGTFDLSVLQLKEGLFEVISTAGDTRLGGDDFDGAIADFIRTELNLDELTDAESVTISAAAREAKESLSTAETHMIRLPFLRDGESFELEMTRDQLESILTPILKRTRAICERAFAEAANKGAKAIDHLILVGGSTRTPLVQRKLKEWFELEPNISQHPDEAIALGAAIQAGMLCGRIRQVILVDVTPLSLGIETFGGLMNVIIPRNSTIPTKAGEMFTNAVDHQKSMAIRVLQGERELAKDNWLLGEVAVPFTPGAKGKARVGVQFSIDSDGILEVLARDTETGEDHLLEIRNAAVDVDDEKVEKMVSESIDYAFDDMNERILVEARMKSAELLPAVESALEQIADRLSPEEVQSIKEAADAVQSLIDSETSDANALKAANRNLDEATQTLAAALVEAAFDAI